LRASGITLHGVPVGWAPVESIPNGVTPSARHRKGCPEYGFVKGLRSRYPECVVVKITGQIPRRRNQAVEWDSSSLVAALVINEEEGLVFQERPAELSFVLVEVELLTRGCEKAAGV
jgi:hypothetical protein